MKKQLFIFSMFLSISSIMGSGDIDMVNAMNDGENIRVEWKSSDESNVKEFAVERKTLNGEFIALETIKAKGSNSYYSYIDRNAYKVTDVFFIYRVAIYSFNRTEPSYTKEVSVSHNISGVKRTWGSIKAMFR